MIDDIPHLRCLRAPPDGGTYLRSQRTRMRSERILMRPVKRQLGKSGDSKMPCLERGELSKIVRDVFRGSSQQYHDPQTLLSEFQYAFGTLHRRVKEEVYARGCVLAKLTAADWSNKDKVGITIDSLIDAIGGHLEPVPAEALHSTMFSFTAARARATLDRCTTCYLEGYRDATNAIIARILDGTAAPTPSPSAHRPTPAPSADRSTQVQDTDQARASIERGSSGTQEQRKPRDAIQTSKVELCFYVSRRPPFCSVFRCWCCARSHRNW